MKILRISLVVLAVIAFSTISVCSSDLPELKIEKYTLSNGLDVILHEDHSIPVVAVNVWYHVGSKNEKPGRTGFAHLFEHMMFQGSPHYDGEYFTPIQAIGGQVNGSTSEDRTNYWENMPANYLELALAMESDRMGYLHEGITQEKLDTQKDVVKNERRQGVDNQPYGKAEEYLLDLLYPSDHPYSWTVIGSLEDLSNATLDDVKEFFKKYYAPNNASLCIAGDFDPVKTKELIEKYFGTISPGVPIERIVSFKPKLEGVRRIYAEDNVQLPRVYYAWHTPARFQPGDAEMDLLVNILTDGKTSRLFKSLVYDKQIAQNVYAYQESRSISGILNIVATAKPGVSLEELETALDEELNKLLKEGITAEELTDAKTTFEAGFIRGIQNVGGFGGRADLLNLYNTFTGSPDMLEWDLSRYSNATIESVMKAAKENITLNARAILQIVPQGTLTKSETDIDRSVMPEPMPEPTFTPPSIQTATLSNGIKLLLVEDDRLPLIDMNIVIQRGWSADPHDKFGVGSMTADMLNEGTKTRNALEISDEAKKIAANIGTGSYLDASTISLNCLKKNFDEALNLTADIILNPTFPQDEIDRIKKQYLGALQQEAAQPFAMALKAYFRILYGEKHPYSQPYTGNGTEETINAITRDDMVAYYKANYFPNVTTIAISGNISLDEAKNKLENTFKNWKQGEVSPLEFSDVNQNKTTIYIIDKPAAPQSVIIAGNLAMKRNNPDYTAFTIANRALGGIFTSRINLNLREDKGYTYGANSFISARKELGAFTAYSQVHAQFTKESVYELYNEIKGITAEMPITDDELNTHKNGVIKSFPQSFENISAITGGLSNLAQFNLPLDNWQTFSNRIQQIDTQKANEAAKKYIKPDELTIVVVGDRASIEDGLKELGIGEVVVLEK